MYTSSLGHPHSVNPSRGPVLQHDIRDLVVGQAESIQHLLPARVLVQHAQERFRADAERGLVLFDGSC